VLKSPAPIWAPVLIGVRTTWPIAWLGSWNASGRRAPVSSVWVVSMSAVIVTPSGMSLTARTVGNCVGVGVGPVPPPPLGLLPISTTIPTNAMTARNTPMSRTSRFERFKLGLPEPV
jgi:hypothetical protein